MWVSGVLCWSLAVLVLLLVLPRCGQAALAQAKQDAADNGWSVVQDVSWPGYDTVPRRIFEV